MADVLNPATLQAFLQGAAGQRFVWGTHDCVLMVADWLITVRGIEDPAAAYRGRYSDEAEMQALIAPQTWQDVMASIIAGLGIAETATPGDGDVAIVQIGEQETSAIMVNGSWVFATTTGIAWARVSRPVIKAWQVFDA